MIWMKEQTDPRFERQIKKGVMEMLVLQLLSEGPNYGYQLLTRLADTPSGLLKVKEGTLYPILYRLEEDGMLESGWQTGEGRATPKKMYTITEKGKKELLRQHQIWDAFQADIVFIQNGEEMEHEI